MAAVRGRLIWRLGEVVKRRTDAAHEELVHRGARLGGPQGRSARRRAPYGRERLPGPAQLLHRLRGGGDGWLELVVERLDDGEVSPYLTDELRAGDKVEMRGPVGGWFTWEAKEGGPLLLVAGGSGIAPLIAMIRHRAAAGSHAPTRLLYSSRSREETIYADELDRLAASDASLAVVHTLTRAQPPGWEGYRRRIDKEMLGEVARHPEGRLLAFVCGSTPLVETAATALVELGHDPTRIKTERFGPTGG